MDRPLRLIAGNPLDQLARTIEALLVIASAPLSVQDLADAADDHVERVETALGLVGERYQEGRSGIVLENVAGGWAFRASRDAAESCARLFEKPAQRNLPRHRSRPWRSSRTSARAHGPTSRASGASRQTPPWRTSSSAA